MPKSCRDHMKVLVIGSSGMLGSVVLQYLVEHGHEVIDIACSRKYRKETILLDVTDKSAMSDFLGMHRVDCVVNCAALLVKDSQKYPGTAILLNSWFPHFLEEQLPDTYIIQAGTAGVYSGRGSPFSERSMKLPDNFYSETKSLGEISGANTLLVRSDFWGSDSRPQGTGLFNWIMTMDQKTVNGYSQVRFNGVSNLEFARFVDMAVKNRPIGAYNMASKETISKAQFIKEVSDEFALGISVAGLNEPVKNASVQSMRADIDYPGKTFREQLADQKAWIRNHKELYRHYVYGD